jgi:hypothetical protein
VPKDPSGKSGDWQNPWRRPKASYTRQTLLSRFDLDLFGGQRILDPDAPH